MFSQNTLFLEKSFKQPVIIPYMAANFYGHRGVRSGSCTLILQAAGGPIQRVKRENPLADIDFDLKS